MQLTEVHKIGMLYGHFYELEGVQLFQECSQEEYEALGLRGAGAPKNLPKGAEWKHSGCFYKFDTDSGFLEDGTFSANPEEPERVWVKSGGKVSYVESNKIDANGNFTEEVAPN